MKLNTSAVTPSWARCAGSRRSRSVPSAAVNSFSYRTATGAPTSSRSCSVSSSGSCALRLSSSAGAPHHSGWRAAISIGNIPLKIALRENGVAVGRML